jgi:hypothetical protein
VQQVSPVCQVARRFTVVAHKGRNRVRFPARRSRFELVAGTYSISVSTRSGHLIRRATLVVLDDAAPTRAQIAAARKANVCASSTRFTSPGGTNSFFTSGRQGGSASNAAAGGKPSVGGLPVGGDTSSGNVLGSTIEKTARAIQPGLVVLLALAIALLAVASAPRLAGARHTRVNHLLVRHRAELAGLGTAALLAVIIVFLLG